MGRIASSFAFILLSIINAPAQQAGDLDSTFSADGIAQIDVQGNSNDGALAMALRPDGRMVLVGSSTGPGLVISLAIVQLLDDGTPDGPFGTNGRVVTSIGGVDASAMGVALQPD